MRKPRFTIFAVVEEPMARELADAAYKLGIPQAHAVRWAVAEWLPKAAERAAALAAHGAPPPPPIGGVALPKGRPPRGKPKAKPTKRPEPGVDEPF